MEPPGPSADASTGKGHSSTAKSDVRYRMQLVDKMPNNPKRIVFESTQQRYEIPLRQDDGSPFSHDARRSTYMHHEVPPPSLDPSQRRTHAAQRKVDKVPCNPKRVVVESTQERFDHQIRPDNVSPSSTAICSDDDDFMPFPNKRSSTHIDNSNNPGPRKSRQPRAGLSTGECSEGRQSRPTTINVRCNPADVIATSAFMTPDQRTAIEYDGFGQFLRLKIDAIDNKNHLSWLLDCTDPNTMLITIAPGKVLPITPWIIALVLGLPIGGENLKNYSRNEGVKLRRQFIHDLNQNLDEDRDIHISNLHQEILHGNVNPLMKRCFFIILCNRLLLPSSNKIGSLDIKRTMDHESFSDIDWSQLVFNDLQLAVRAWHNRDKTKLTHNIYGCTIFLLLHYLDNIDHPLSPVDRLSTPRIMFYDNDLIQHLTDVDTNISIHGALTFGSLPFKSWSTTCYATADIRGVFSHDTHWSPPRMPHCNIPRLQDLLSQPIEGLTGLRKSRVQSFFSHFDDTLSLNITFIDQSLGNIMRAHAKLSDQFRPFLQAIGSSQSQIDDTLYQNTSSLEQSLGNIVTSHAKLADHLATILHTLGISQSRNNNITAGTSRTMHTQLGHGDRESVHRTPSLFPGYDSSYHGSFVAASTLLRSPIVHRASVGINTPGPSSVFTNPPTVPFGSPVHGVVSPHHISEGLPRPSTSPKFTSSVDVAGSNPHNLHGQGSPMTFAKDTTSVLKWPEQDHIPTFKFHGKRLTKKPSKYYSPFKHGIISRPPPNTELSLRMHAFLCANPASLKRKTLMHFGTNSLTGHDISLSFGVGNFIESMFLDGFIKCIAEDDLIVRPECLGYRIFLRPLVADILKSDSCSYDKPHPLCRPDTIVETIKRCLPLTDLKKAKLIFLPVLHLRHWSVYYINLSQSRIDVLDSMDYSSNNQVSWDTYHSPMGHTLMQRLSVALSLAAPRSFPPFNNWRHVPIQLPLETNLNDSALFSMKFIEFYDGEGHGSLRTAIHPDQSMELRAEMLQYLVFHSANGVHAPDDLLQFRTADSHPAFHPLFY